MNSNVDDARVCYRALGTTFGVSSDRGDLLEWFDSAWRHARCSGPAQHELVVVSPDPGHGSEWTIVLDGAVPEAVAEELVLARMHWEINRWARAARGDAVLLHAAVVEIDGVGVVLVGPSGTGKTTLTLGLCERGAAYLSDELAPLGRAVPTIEAYPKPLALRPGAWPLVREFHPNVGPTIAPLLRDEWFVAPPSAAASTVPALVVFTTYDRAAVGASTSALDPADALVHLCEHADELAAQAPGAFGALGVLAARASAHTLRGSDLDSMCDLVFGLAASTEVLR